MTVSLLLHCLGQIYSSKMSEEIYPTQCKNQKHHKLKFYSTKGT